MGSCEPRLHRALRRWLPALLLAGCAAPQSRSPVQSEPREAWTALARRAQVVVIGRVIGVESAWEKKQIVSTARVQPLETLKDVRPAGGADIIEVRFLGGQVGPWAQEFSQEATLIEGQTAALFLAIPRDRGGVGAGSLCLLGEDALLPLLRPQDPPSHLKNDRRLVARLQVLRAAVKEGQ